MADWRSLLPEVAGPDDDELASRSAAIVHGLGARGLSPLLARLRVSESRWRGVSQSTLPIFLGLGYQTIHTGGEFRVVFPFPRTVDGRSTARVSLEILFHPPNNRFTAAHDRAQSVWSALLEHEQYIASGSAHDDSQERHRPTIRLATVGRVRRLIGVELSSGPVPTCERNPFGIADVDHVVDDLARALKSFEFACDSIHAAVLATERNSLSRRAVMGFCGELLVWAREGRELQLEWSEAWEAPFDFNIRGTRDYFEVKSTTNPKSGRAHFSAAELEFLLKPDRSCTLVLVELCPELVEQLWSLVREAATTPIPANDTPSDSPHIVAKLTKWRPALRRLISAGAWHAVRRLLARSPSKLLDLFEAIETSSSSRIVARSTPAFTWAPRGVTESLRELQSFDSAFSFSFSAVKRASATNEYTASLDDLV